LQPDSPSKVELHASNASHVSNISHVSNVSYLI
jgi:hypothetical protein